LSLSQQKPCLEVILRLDVEMDSRLLTP
jgi:hypothetical protein